MARAQRWAETTASAQHKMRGPGAANIKSTGSKEQATQAAIARDMRLARGSKRSARPVGGM
jgi:hypothetical protein